MAAWWFAFFELKNVVEQLQENSFRTFCFAGWNGTFVLLLFEKNRAVFVHNCKPEQRQYTGKHKRRKGNLYFKKAGVYTFDASIPKSAMLINNTQAGLRLRMLPRGNAFRTCKQYVLMRASYVYTKL